MSLTVAELIKELRRYPADWEVRVARGGAYSDATEVDSFVEGGQHVVVIGEVEDEED